MDKFREISTFVAVAEHGGFAAAARAVGLSPPAVTRLITALEDRLGTRLFVRTTRTVRLTDSGTRFLKDAKRLLEDLAEAEDAAQGLHAQPRGHLRVTAPVLFGCHYVTPLLGTFMDTHPHITAQALYLDRVVNLVEDGQDVAIRIGELPDSSLTATRVGQVCRVVVATPDYWQQHGTPTHPSDLAEHRAIQADALGHHDSWQFAEDGATFMQPINARLKMNSNDAIIHLISTGWGAAQLLSYQVANLIAGGKLQPVLQDYEVPPLPVHVVHQEGRRTSAKVRAFVDFMVTALRANPALQGRP